MASSVTFVDKTQDLQRIADEMLSTTQVAVDTESDSFYHYREKICLIQASYLHEGAQKDVIIDPLAPGISLEPFCKVLSAPHVIKVFHDVGYDLLLFKRHVSTIPRPVFDTMLAMRMLGEKNFGLAHVLGSRFSITLDKSMQRSDWSQRPLTPKQLAYAANDTHFLLPLMKLLREELVTKQRDQWFDEECVRLLHKEANTPKTEEERFWGTKGMKKLREQTLSVARSVFHFREEVAEQWDKPPFRVFGNEVLFELAEMRPSSMSALSSVKGLSQRVLHQFGKTLVQLCSAPPPYSPPAREKRSAEQLKAMQAHEVRFEALREKRKQIAANLGLDPEIVLSNATLWDLAEKPQLDLSKHSDFEGWRKQYVVPQLLLNSALR